MISFSSNVRSAHTCSARAWLSWWYAHTSLFPFFIMLISKALHRVEWERRREKSSMFFSLLHYRNFPVSSSRWCSCVNVENFMLSWVIVCSNETRKPQRTERVNDGEKLKIRNSKIIKLYLFSLWMVKLSAVKREMYEISLRENIFFGLFIFFESCRRCCCVVCARLRPNRMNHQAAELYHHENISEFVTFATVDGC